MTLPYRTRRRLQGLGIAVLILVLLAVLASLVWLLWLDRFVVYSEDGIAFDFSLSNREIQGVEATRPAIKTDYNITIGVTEVEDTGPKELVQLTGYYADVTSLTQELDLVLEQAAYVTKDTPVMLDVKDIYGNFLYSSTVGEYRSSRVDIARVDELIDYLNGKGAYLIARLPAFKDQQYGLNHVPYGLHHSSGRYLYIDEDHCYWLDPNTNGTITYLTEIALELKKMGFDEVVFDYFWYPDADNLAFKGNRTESLQKAATRLTEALATESFCVSFVSQEPKFPLPEGRTRLYLANRSASEAAQIAAETGLGDDIQIKLVFIAEGNDTRFNAYGALRPISAARLDEEE